MTNGTEPAGKTSKELTRDLLSALGIDRVINVDDGHSQGDHQSKEDVLGALRANTIDRVLAARVVLPDDEDEGAALLDVDEIIDRIDQDWESLDDSQRVELTQAAIRAAEANEGTVDTQSSSVSGDNAALLALPEILPESVEFVRMSLRGWRDPSSQVLLDDGKPTLLLFDRSFEREGGSSTAGDDLVRGVLSKDNREHVYVGLLTHTATDAGREAEIAAEVTSGFDGSRPVIVVAKNRLQDKSFPEALRLVLFASEVEEFRRHILDSISQASSATMDHLAKVDRYLLLAAFESARVEGVYEPDHAMRMATAFTRKSLAKLLRSGAFIDSVLGKLRGAGAVRLYLNGANKPQEFAEVKWDEQFESGDFLASLAMPIEVGDVFKVRDLHGVGKSRGKDRYFILLAQECDLSMRLEGRRSNDLIRVVLTELREAVTDENGKRRSLKQNQAEFGALSKDSQAHWRVEFAKQLVVPTLALDACVLSGTGRAVVTLTGEAPKVLPTSWQLRYVKMKKEAKAVMDEFRKMESAIEPVEGKEADMRLAERHLVAALLGTATKHQEGLTAKIDLESSRIDFGIERFARITDTAARGLLSLLLQHQARPAFDGNLFYEVEGS
ncbi:MAG: hypothetical protein ACK5LO_02945 [Leucobacter sp.]